MNIIYIYIIYIGVYCSYIYIIEYNRGVVPMQRIFRSMRRIKVKRGPLPFYHIALINKRFISRDSINSSMEGEKPIISMSSSIHCVECKEAWELLTEREQNYAYFFLRGAWEGSKISYFQRSFESPPLFVLFRTVFNTHLPAYKNIAMQNGILMYIYIYIYIYVGVTEDEWTQLMVYAAALFQNTGNYKSFGDTKFIPELNPTRFMDIIQLSPNYNPNKALIDEL